MSACDVTGFYSASWLIIFQRDVHWLLSHHVFQCISCITFDLNCFSTSTIENEIGVSLKI